MGQIDLSRWADRPAQPRTTVAGPRGAAAPPARLKRQNRELRCWLDDQGILAPADLAARTEGLREALKRALAAA